jgi:hypothetical protein
MGRLAQTEIALSALAVCLLVLAHAAGLPVVLCIAGTGHIAVEAQALKKRISPKVFR